MRRLFLPLALVALTGTLVAQTPYRSDLVAQVGSFSGKMSWESSTRDGDKMRMKGVRFEFGGVLVTADEAFAETGQSPAIQLSGNVRITPAQK